MKDYCGYVNVFQGCGEIDLPQPQGVAAAWRFSRDAAEITRRRRRCPSGGSQRAVTAAAIHPATDG